MNRVLFLTVNSSSSQADDNNFETISALWPGEWLNRQIQFEFLLMIRNYLTKPTTFSFILNNIIHIFPSNIIQYRHQLLLSGIFKFVGTDNFLNVDKGTKKSKMTIGNLSRTTLYARYLHSKGNLCVIF